MEDEGEVPPVQGEGHLVSPQRVRLPNDLILQLKVDTGECHGLPTERKAIVLSSTVPAMVNFTVGSSMEEMVSNIKYGYTEKAKVPLTCMETGMCFNALFEPKMTILIDRPLQVYSWVKLGDNIGFITSIRSTVDVEVRNSGKVICNLNGSDIKPSQDFRLGMYVYYEGWIGCVSSIEHKLRLLYDKGHECYVIDKEDGAKAYRRNYSYTYVGDDVSPSAQDVKNAEWIQQPSTLTWICLRWLNFGYSSNTMAKVLENKINMVSVSWNSPTDPETTAPKPETDFPQELLSKLVRLDLCPDWWYGMDVKCGIKPGDQILEEDMWDDKIAEELGFEPMDSRTPPWAERGDTMIAEEAVERPVRCDPGNEVVGKIMFRRAVATVLWHTGRTSEARVQELLPYYPPSKQEYPLPPGTIVYKPEYCPYKAVVQTSHREDGAVWVKWFGEVSGDVHESMKFKSETEEDTYELDIENSMCHIGLIVIRRTDYVPGVVVGVNRKNGMVRVKFNEDILELEPGEIDKFRSVAHFIQGHLFWVPLKEHPLSVQKHVVTSSASASLSGNIIPAQVVTHGAPVEVKTFEELQSAPSTHRFIGAESAFDPAEVVSGCLEVRAADVQTLLDSPPPGMWIRTFVDKPNLFSVLMAGMPDTALEGALYQFDLNLPKKYPAVLPNVAYVHHGLGTGSELPGPEVSNKSLIDMESMFEPGTDLSKVLLGLRENLIFLDKFGQDLREPSTISYSGNILNVVTNQKILASLFPTITSWLIEPPAFWETEVLSFYRFEVPRLIIRMKKWLGISRLHYEYELGNIDDYDFSDGEEAKYPLLPIDTILQAEIRNDLTDLANTYALIF